MNILNLINNGTVSELKQFIINDHFGEIVETEGDINPETQKLFSSDQKIILYERLSDVTKPTYRDYMRLSRFDLIDPLDYDDVFREDIPINRVLRVFCDKWGTLTLYKRRAELLMRFDRVDLVYFNEIDISKEVADFISKNLSVRNNEKIFRVWRSIIKKHNYQSIIDYDNSVLFHPKDLKSRPYVLDLISKKPCINIIRALSQESDIIDDLIISLMYHGTYGQARRDSFGIHMRQIWPRHIKALGYCTDSARFEECALALGGLRLDAASTANLIANRSVGVLNRLRRFLYDGEATDELITAAIQCPDIYHQYYDINDPQQHEVIHGLMLNGIDPCSDRICITCFSLLGFVRVMEFEDPLSLQVHRICCTIIGKQVPSIPIHTDLSLCIKMPENLPSKAPLSEVVRWVQQGLDKCNPGMLRTLEYIAAEIYDGENYMDMITLPFDDDCEALIAHLADPNA